MTSRPALIDTERFGPWALVTGASSGIGREFARQLAAHGLHLVLASRRLSDLQHFGRDLSLEFAVQCRPVAVDLSDASNDPLAAIDAATRDVDIGLVVSNAGTGVPGEFLAADRGDLHAIVRLNVLAHLDLAHHFGRRLAARRRGGLLLVGALGASEGIPYMANAGATKAFVRSLGEALHVEFARERIHVTVLVPGPTDTPVLAKLGIDPRTLPIKPVPVAQCVAEALRALDANRGAIVPGALMRMVHAIVPDSISRGMMAAMFSKALASNATPATTKESLR